MTLKTDHTFTLAAIGDIGGLKTYHIGDEAMLEANLQRLRRAAPEIGFTVISRDPEFSRGYFHADAVMPIGFASHADAEAERMARLQHVLDAAVSMAQTGSTADVQLLPVLDALSKADGLLISGGGNLSSSWPQHLFERVALIQAARILNKRVVITGQTIGPNLEPPHRRLLVESLPLVDLLGVRELPSFHLALEFGVSPYRLSYQPDDALLLDEAPVDGMFTTDRPRIGLTFHPFSPLTDYVPYRALAQQLDALARQTGAELWFIPHVADTDDGASPSDPRVGALLKTLMETPLNIVPVETSRRAKWITTQMSMIVSSRYHPLVFGVSGDVPGLGIYTDHYTEIKLKGALTHAELDDWTLPLSAALNGSLLAAALELWSQRDSIRQYLSGLKRFWQTLEQEWVASMLAAFRDAATAEDRQHST